MNPLDTEALAADMIAGWEIKEAGDQALVRQAIALEPERMRRIHEMVMLLYVLGDRGLLLDSRVSGLGTVRSLLAGGAAGIAIIESRLVDFFFAAAPREIFDLPGTPWQPEAGVVVLFNIFVVRTSHLEDVAWHHPLAAERRPIDRLDERLARAIAALDVQRPDQAILCVLGAGFMDRSAAVRLAAVRRAAALADQANLREQLQQLSLDDDLAMRRAALAALAPFAGRAEFADSIASFSADPEPAMRLEVLRLIMAGPQARHDDARLVRLVFDADPAVAQAARACFTDEDIQRYLTRLAERAGRGRRLSSLELAILATAPTLDPATRGRALRARLRLLRHRSGAGTALVETLRALGRCVPEADAATWREAAAAAEESADPRVADAWRRLRAEAKARP